MLGEIRYLDKADAFVGDGLHPSGYVVKAVVPKAAAKDKGGNSGKEESKKHIQVRLASWHLKELKGAIGGKDEEFDGARALTKVAIDLIDTDKDAYEKELASAEYLLHLLQHQANDYVKSKFLLPDDFDHAAKSTPVVEKADALINTIDTDKIKLAIAIKVAKDDKEGKKESDHRTALKDVLVKALHLKAHGLISAGNEIELNATMTQFRRWATDVDKKYQMLNYRNALFKKHYGQAVKILVSILGGEKDNGGPYPESIVVERADALVRDPRMGFMEGSGKPISPGEISSWFEDVEDENGVAFASGTSQLD